MKNASNWLKITLSQLHGLVKEERRIGVEILEILYEVERRKAYAELGYDGLYSFCVHELKFTDSQSYQRVQAMRALKQLPELKEKISSGAISVSTVSQVQSFFRTEQVAHGINRTKKEKIALFASFENKTSKEVKIKIAELKGEKVSQKLILELDEEAEALWKAAKGQLAHKSLGNDLNTLKLLLKNYLGPIPKKHVSNKPVLNKTDGNLDSVAKPSLGKPSLNLQRNASRLTKETQPAEVQSRYIPKKIKIEIKARDQNKCQNCGSTHAIQIEHIKPFALHGSNEPSNLKLLCRSCNLHQGIKIFGTEIMKRSVK